MILEEGVNIRLVGPVDQIGNHAQRLDLILSTESADHHFLTETVCDLNGVLAKIDRHSSMEITFFHLLDARAPEKTREIPKFC